MKRKRFFLLLGVFIILFAVSIIYYQYNVGHWFTANRCTAGDVWGEPIQDKNWIQNMNHVICEAVHLGVPADIELSKRIYGGFTLRVNLLKFILIQKYKDGYLITYGFSRSIFVNDEEICYSIRTMINELP